MGMHFYPQYIQAILSIFCSTMHTIVFIMGVSGVGKTTIGKLLAEALALPFIDADDYHSANNKIKMQQGIALTDEDRLPWLQSLNGIAKTEAQIAGAVIACSALKEHYRTILSEGLHKPIWIYLHAQPEIIKKRVSARKEHFMPASLLPSQFAALEEPKTAICIDSNLSPEAILAEILKHLK